MECGEMVRPLHPLPVGYRTPEPAHLLSRGRPQLQRTVLLYSRFNRCGYRRCVRTAGAAFDGEPGGNGTLVECANIACGCINGRPRIADELYRTEPRLPTETPACS